MKIDVLCVDPLADVDVVRAEPHTPGDGLRAFVHRALPIVDRELVQRRIVAAATEVDQTQGRAVRGCGVEDDIGPFCCVPKDSWRGYVPHWTTTVSPG